MSVLFWALPLRSCGQITLPLRNSVFLSEGGSQAKLSLLSLLELPLGDLNLLPACTPQLICILTNRCLHKVAGASVVEYKRSPGSSAY